MAILQTSKVLTLDYWKLASDLQVGDIVFNQQGKPVRVKLVKNFRAPRCFEVTFGDGTTIAGDDNLILPLENEKYRLRARTYKGVFKFSRPTLKTKLIELRDLELWNKNRRRIYSVATALPLQFPHQTLPVPPFIFGFWFFNRRAKDHMCPPGGKGEFIHEKFKDAGYKVIEHKMQPNGERVFEVQPTILSHLVPLVPTSIPNNYLLADTEQRQALLDGILHSKTKNIDPDRCYTRVSGYSKRLMSQVQMLAESLGCRTKMDQHPQNGYYRVQIYQKDKPFAKFRKDWRMVAAIKEIVPQSCVHIETEEENGSIVVGEGFIPCH